MEKVDLLIDADPLIYRVGFSLEERVYYLSWSEVNWEHPDDPDYDFEHTAYVETAERRDRLATLLNLHPDETLSQLVPVPETSEMVVFGRMKQSIQDILDRAGAYLLEQNKEIGDVRLYLTGEGNFRDTVATTKKYKGNRDNASRPFWYRELRTYLVMHWDAVIVEGMEADDAVSIEQWGSEGNSTMICTIDKDLRMIPGYFYDYRTKKAEIITPKQGYLHFCHQMLTGDATDNIPGLHGIGKKTAEKILPSALATKKAMWSTVLATYTDCMEQRPEKYPKVPPEQYLLEQARLLWMLQYPDQLFTPPGTPDGSIKGFLENLPPGDSDAKELEL